MTQIIRTLFAYSTFFLFQKVAQRTSLFLLIVIATSTVFLFSDYISDRLSGTLWNMSGDISQDEAEEIVSEVVIEKGDTLSTVLKKQNLSNSEIQSLIKSASTQPLLSKLGIGQVLKFYYEVELVEQEESELVEESEELEPNKLNEPLEPESLLLESEPPKEKKIDTYTTRTITIITITLVFDNSPFI